MELSNTVRDRMALVPAYGASQYALYGELANVPARSLVAIPDHVSFTEAAATWAAYGTAWGGLVAVGALKAGQTVLIGAASSSVGLAAIQTANRIGARPVALIAAVATGLRPVEWRQARLVFQGEFAWPSIADDFHYDPAVQGDDAFLEIPPAWVPPDGRIFLIVHSTKHSNNRGNQAVRTLEISDFPLEIIQSIARMVWRGAGRTGEWGKIQMLSTKLLRRAQLDLWPRRNTSISFYSARHQAMANWKDSIGTFAAAVLAGHGIPDGPERYYSARANSWQRRKDDKGSTGGLGPASKAALLTKVAAPGRAQGEIDSLIAKAGELGMERLVKPNPFASPRQGRGGPAQSPAVDLDDLTPFDF